MRMLKARSWSVAMLAASLTINACGQQQVVGVVVPLTGRWAAYGQSMQRGIELALDEAGQVGDTIDAVSVVWADSASDPATAAARVRTLARDNGAKLVVSATTSDEARSLLPVLDETDTVAVSPSAAATDLTRASQMFYRLLPSEDLEGRRAGRFLREERNHTSVVILSPHRAETPGIEGPFREMFEESLGGTVVTRVQLTGAGWRDELAAALREGIVEGAYLIGPADTALEVVPELRGLGFEGTICATSEINVGETISGNADALQDVFFPQPNFDLADDRAQVRSFVDGFRKRYGTDPDIYAAHAYDAIRLALRVVNDTGVYTGSELRKTMQFGIVDYPGVTGVIRFNDYGDVHRNPIMFIIRDGRAQNFERYIEEERERIRQRIRDLLTG